MCEICGKSPCDSRCPNAPDPVGIMRCISCEDWIFEGDEYYDSADGPICEECIKDMMPLEVLEMVGEKLTKARE